MTDDELKEVIARADAEYDMLKDRVHEQYDEIQKLKEDVEYYKSSSDELIISNRKLREEKLRLNNIIHKAIEYINKHSTYGTPFCLPNGIYERGDLVPNCDFYSDDLLGILKGVDKE